MRWSSVLVLVPCFALACSASPGDTTATDSADLDNAKHHGGGHGGGNGSWRDWSTYPAIATVSTAPSTIYAVSDIHGGYDRAVALLAANGVIAGVPRSPSHAKWAAGDAVLVIVGDLIDKGAQPVETLDFLMALEQDAAAHGGRVIVTLGNHEAEFMVDPSNSKASGSDGVDTELAKQGIAPEDVASGKDPHGAWLRNRPLGALVGSWFFAHAGDTGGASVSQLEATFEHALDAHADFDDSSIVGASSILESRDWNTGPTTGADYAAAVGAKHIVMGHDPQALGARGAIAFVEQGALTRIDCGLSPVVNDSTGKLLRVTQVNGDDVASELDAQGTERALFTSPE